MIAYCKKWRNDGKDWAIFNFVYPFIKKVDPAMAKKLKAAMKEPLITKKFYDPKVVKERFLDFVSKDTKPMTNRPNFENACRDIEGLLGKEVLTPLRLKDKLRIEDVFTNKSASAGSIYPGKNKREAWDIIYTVAEWYYDNLPKDDPFASLPFARAQISGFLSDEGELTPHKTKHKQRLVWCINAAMVLVEALYARPLMNYTMPRIAQYAGGKTPRDIRNKLRSWGYNCNWVCLDYSKYDSTVPKWIIYRVFEMIKNKFPKEEHAVIDWLAYHFVHTKLYMPDGTIVQKAKGIPSGSYFTQIVGSLVNMLMVRTWQYSKYGKEINSKTMDRYDNIMFMVMGDDNIVFFREKPNMKEISSYLKKNFGVVVNTEKYDEGTQWDDPVFLKRSWCERGEWREPLELFINMCHPERHRMYEGYAPIHIVYGYMLAYRLAIIPYINELQMRKLLAENGGAKALTQVPDGALPGSIYWIKITDPALFLQLTREIEKEEANLA